LGKLEVIGDAVSLVVKYSPFTEPSNYPSKLYRNSPFATCDGAGAFSPCMILSHHLTSLKEVKIMASCLCQILLPYITR